MKITDAHRDEIERLYVKEGLNMAQIARRVGCSKTAVGECLASRGIPRRPRTQHPWHLREKARKLRAKGLSYRRIDTQIGVPEGCAYRWLKGDK